VCSDRLNQAKVGGADKWIDSVSETIDIHYEFSWLLLEAWDSGRKSPWQPHGIVCRLRFQGTCGWNVIYATQRLLTGAAGDERKRIYLVSKLNDHVHGNMMTSCFGKECSSKWSVAYRGWCGRCDGPGHPPWGASKGPVFLKECR